MTRHDRFMQELHYAWCALQNARDINSGGIDPADSKLVLELDRLCAWTGELLEQQRSEGEPKKCNNCGAEHPMAEWAKLREIDTPKVSNGMLEMRECKCGSCLAIKKENNAASQ